MKKILYIIGGFIVVLVISAFIAPVIYTFVDYKFYRILSRCVMVGVLLEAIIAVFFLDKGTVRSLVVKYGLRWQKRISLRSISQGFLCSFGVLTVLMVIEVMLGARIIHPNFKSTFLLRVVEYIGAAFIIAFIEEFFFRGLIFNKLRVFSLMSAFLVTNMFYSLVHFLKAHNSVVSEIPTVSDSVRLYISFIEPLAHPLVMFPGFIGLLLFGLVLSFTYWRTGSLYHAIGIHAGAVFLLKADGFILNINHAMPVILYGDKNVYTGILGWIFILIIGVITAWLLRKYPPPTNT